MEASVFFLFCTVAAVNGQLLSPMSAMGMGSGWGGSGWGGPGWHSGMRYPGLMQTSHLSSMTYPTWRSHPLFRMSSLVPDKKIGSDFTSDVINVPKVPSTQEVLTHMALANQNPKPYLDTIADFLYEPQKTRAVLTPVAPIASGMPVASVPAVTSSVQPLYVQGMNLMRANPAFVEDCVQEGTRWERGMDWLY